MIPGNNSVQENWCGSLNENLPTWVHMSEYLMGAELVKLRRIRSHEMGDKVCIVGKFDVLEKQYLSQCVLCILLGA